MPTIHPESCAPPLQLLFEIVVLRSQLVLLPGLTISEKRRPVLDQLQLLWVLEWFANQEGATFFAYVI